MATDYNNFAKTFSKSRKNMKWQELEYFFSLYKKGSILDIGCGNGRFIEQFQQYFRKNIGEYFGIDMSLGLVNEAKKSYPNIDFGVGNMLDISNMLADKKYENIFLIASFHHLETLSEREEMMKHLYEACEIGGKVCMTNWALASLLNREKYKKSQILGSENKFGSSDFSIKIGEFQRFYHCFNISELEYISKKSGFKIIENRVFDNDKNIITILEK